MTARPPPSKKKKKLVPYRIRAILARVARLKNRFVSTLDWTTIHEERRTGALAEAATTAAPAAAAAPAPATAPREYYTPPSHLPPCHRPPPRPPSANNPLSHPPHRVRPELYPVSFPPSISSPRHPRTPHEASEAPSPPRFSASPPLACGHPYYVPRPPLRRRRGGSYVPWVGGAHGRNMCNAQPWLHAGL